jgi:hypothetical protein
VPGDEINGQQRQRLRGLEGRIQFRVQMYCIHLFDVITRQAGDLFQDFGSRDWPATA